MLAASHITNSRLLVPNAEPNAKKILPAFARLLQCLKAPNFQPDVLHWWCEEIASLQNR